MQSSNGGGGESTTIARRPSSVGEYKGGHQGMLDELKRRFSGIGDNVQQEKQDDVAEIQKEESVVVEKSLNSVFLARYKS